MPDPMNALTESVGIRLDRTERSVAELTEAIKKQSSNIDSNTAAIERLERSISNLVSGIENQRRTMADMIKQQSEFLALAKQQTALVQQQTNIIDRLTPARAAS